MTRKQATRKLNQMAGLQPVIIKFPDLSVTDSFGVEYTKVMEFMDGLEPRRRVERSL